MKGRVLGVAGVGLIGGSIALRARAAGARVVGFDADPAALRAATAAGALDAAAGTLGELAEHCEIVVLALPLDAVVAALEGEAALASPELLFDVASVKERVAAAGSHLARFVPSHPLAGREVEGFAGADPGLFEGRTWAVVPSAPAPTEALEALIGGFGARPLLIGAAEHDRLVATSSHLPQLLSVLLGARLAEVAERDPRVRALCGPGMESMLRLARSPVGLWAEIARANAGPLAAELTALAEALGNLAAGLAVGDVGPLQTAFADAQRNGPHSSDCQEVSS